MPSAANGRYFADLVRAAYARRELERIAPDELLKSGADSDAGLGLVDP